MASQIKKHKDKKFLHFWASWSLASRINKITFELYKDEIPFNIKHINMDSKSTKDIVLKYEVARAATILIIDKDGKVINARWGGLGPVNPEDLKKLINI